MGLLKSAGHLIYGSTIARLRYRNNGFWVFGEWFGKRCCDSCLFLANYLAENHPEISCAWVAKEEADLSLLNPRIRKVLWGSKEAQGLVRNAAYIFVNDYLEDVAPDCGVDISGPVVVDLWHGVPWKTIGYEASRKNDSWIRAWFFFVLLKKSTSYWLSLNRDLTEIFKTGFWAGEGSIIEAGYPRNMEFYDPEKVAQRRIEFLDHLRALGHAVDQDTRIITYMPTFRDQRDQSFSFDSMAKDPELQRILGKYNAIIIQKAHFAEKNKSTGSSSEIITENDYPAALLLAASDILITDYSSCFFDYLLLDRPIIHYLYDYEYYRNQDRGLYYSKEDAACGDTPEDVTGLLKSIETNLEHPEKDAALRKERRGYFLEYESADSCERIYQAITAER